MERIPIAREDIIVTSKEGYPLIVVGKGSYAGSIDIHASIDMDVNSPYLFQIGRYTSIAENLNIICNLNHDYRSVFQGIIPEFADENSASFRRRKGQNDTFLEQKGMVLIGNDVWIGDDVTIVSDVNGVIGFPLIYHPLKI